MYRYLVIFISLSCVFVVFDLSAASTDPTKPFDYSASSVAGTDDNKLVLQSIVHGDGIHTAVINGQVMVQGDTLAQYKIIVIDDNSVILKSDSERVQLYVFKNEVLQ